MNCLSTINAQQRHMELTSQKSNDKGVGAYLYTSTSINPSSAKFRAARQHTQGSDYLEHALQLVGELRATLSLDLGDTKLLRIHAGAAPHEQPPRQDALVEGLKYILALHFTLQWKCNFTLQWKRAWSGQFRKPFVHILNTLLAYKIEQLIRRMPASDCAAHSECCVQHQGRTRFAAPPAHSGTAPELHLAHPPSCPPVPLPCCRAAGCCPGSAL